MLEESRIDVYDYLCDLVEAQFPDTSVYKMDLPQDLTSDDTKNGFIVVHVGEINDESEFSGEAYGWVRCYLEVCIPPAKRGQLNKDLYRTFENGVNTLIKNAAGDATGTYNVQEGSLISSDSRTYNGANNTYYTFIKSFIVTINEQE